MSQRENVSQKEENNTCPCAGAAVQHPPFKVRQSEVEKEEIGARGLASRRDDLERNSCWANHAAINNY